MTRPASPPPSVAASASAEGAVESGTPELDALAAIAELGAETETERAVKRILPWVVSILAHLGLVGLGFLVTWTVVLLQREPDPVLIVADFDALTYEPLTQVEDAVAEPVDVARRETAPQDAAVDDPLERLEQDPWWDADPLDLLAPAGAGAAVAPVAPRPQVHGATFVGISSANARRIVYVIDASGSMIGVLPIVIEELARSLDGLVPRQSFSVIFFSENRAYVVPPDDELLPATEPEKARVLQWIDRNIIPMGRSNPVEALRSALALEPDVIFLLSENITGSGEFEIDQKDLLAMLDDLNPRDPETRRRRTRINCVQFRDPDPLETLLVIAREHGGVDGYKYLDRAELGLEGR